MITNGRIKNSIQSSFTIQIPLYVSYLHHNNEQNTFVNSNYASTVRLTAVYDTGALWDDGVEITSGKLNGELFLSSILITDKDKRLLLKFKTKTKFRGVFIPVTKGKRNFNILLISTVV